jgi:prophage antirepressor-like protein
MTTKTFDFNALIDGINVSHKVRAVLVEGKPWFVAADVCRVLDMDTTKVGRTVDEDEKDRHLVPTPGGPQRMTIISKPGLYKLLMRSDKPVAKPFQDWLAREVLPAIDETGGYMLAGADRAKVREGNTETMPLPATYQEAPRLLALPN